MLKRLCAVAPIVGATGMSIALSVAAHADVDAAQEVWTRLAEVGAHPGSANAVDHLAASYEDIESCLLGGHRGEHQQAEGEHLARAARLRARAPTGCR